MEDIRPFCLFGNIYFVGGRDVSVHVIDTGDGLIMIDTGYPYMRNMILNNMRTVGLDPYKLRILLHSHGHYDHIGSSEFFRELSGAGIAISRIDNEIINGNLDLSWASELGHDKLPFFSGDILLDDGDIVQLGNTCIRCVSAPGHTAGTLALFFSVKDTSGKNLVCAMHGGVGINSMERSFLDKYGLPFSCRDDFRKGLHRLAKEHVDIVLGNHPEQNDTEGKLHRLEDGDINAFVNSMEWQNFLISCEKKLDNMLLAERNGGL